MTTIEEKRLNRFIFLRKLYEITDGNYLKSLSMWTIGEELGWEKETSNNIVEYLVHEGLIKYQALGGFIGISHQGVLEIEEALSNPEKPTQYFPPIINIVTGDLRGAIVNVDSTLTSVQQTIGTESKVDGLDRKELLDLIEELKRILATIPKENEKEAETVAWAAEEYIDTLLSDETNRSKIEITKEGLEKAARNLAGIMPQVLTIAIQIIEFVQKKP